MLTSQLWLRDSHTSHYLRVFIISLRALSTSVLLLHFSSCPTIILLPSTPLQSAGSGLRTQEISPSQSRSADQPGSHSQSSSKHYPHKLYNQKEHCHCRLVFVSWNMFARWGTSMKVLLRRCTNTYSFINQRNIGWTLNLAMLSARDSGKRG